MPPFSQPQPPSAISGVFCTPCHKPVSFDALGPIADPIAPELRADALKALQAYIGDCTRCPLAYAGRHNIVFADGDPNARLMFVGRRSGRG